MERENRNKLTACCRCFQECFAW